eukprot:1146356-Pelagomonas_calceolata.AAC.8
MTVPWGCALLWASEPLNPEKALVHKISLNCTGAVSAGHVAAHHSYAQVTLILITQIQSGFVFFA